MWRQVLWQPAIVNNTTRRDRRRWLTTIRHPARKDGVIAVALLVLPWVAALGLKVLHHLDATTVTILGSVSVGLPAVWLAWVPIRNASRSGTPSAGPGPAVSYSSVPAAQLVCQRPDVTGKPVSLRPRPTLLAGRADLLSDLDTRLATGDDPWPRIVVLCGLGGTGKTSVAVEYAHRHLAEVGVAWQFAADDPAVLAAEFGKLAAQLGAGDVLGLRDPVASVHAALATFRAGWLLVFDNAPDWASIEGFLPPAGRGQVLITSQNSNWSGQVLQVPVLEPDVAADFLVSRTGDPDRETAVSLAGELGGLPLALEQAAAFMQATGGTLAVYLALFRQWQADLLTRGEPTGYKTVASTWAVALDRLQRTEPRAIGLLRLLAFCAPEAIPLRLLLQRPRRLTKWVPWRVALVLVSLMEHPLAVSDAIGALRRYSLVTPAGDGSVSLHRLVQAVTAGQMSAKLARQWQQATAALIEAAIPENPAQPDTWPDFAALLPHAQVALTADSDSRQRIAAYLGYRGSYVAAREFSRRMLDEQMKARGPEHRSTLAARAKLASWTGEAGDAAGARDQYAALIPVMERTLGPEHRSTLAARAKLARSTGEAGDAARACDQYAALMTVHERTRGPEHPDTLATRANLAFWTGEAGDAAGARDQLTELVPVLVRTLGPKHPGTLRVRANLAILTGEAGDAAGARDQCAALIPVMERTLGPKHPDILVARGDLASWTGKAGDAAGARDQYAELVPVLVQVLGSEHWDTLMARGDLAIWTGEAGDAAGARDQLTELVPVFVQVLGSERPDTLDAAVAHGYLAKLVPVLVRVLGSERPDTLDAAVAHGYLAKLVPALEQVLGSEHPDTLAARGELAILTGEAGDAAGARDQLTELVPVLVRVRGPEHRSTLAARAKLTFWTGEAGDAAGARDQLTELVPVLVRVRGPEHRSTLAARADLAHWTREAFSDTGVDVD